MRVECETLAVDAPLEFFCVVSGTDRARVGPALAGQAVGHPHWRCSCSGCKPGTPVQYSEAAKKWIPPHGPPLQITLEYEKDGKTVSVPAYRWMRDMKTKKPMPPLTWIFAGSRVMDDGNYAADVTGYLVSVVNFDLTVIDIPELASNANESLEWERNPDVVPPAGTKVTMVIEPAGERRTTARRRDAAEADARRPAPNATRRRRTLADDAMIAAAATQWEHGRRARTAQRVREAAQTHYDVINALRREQQRLIDEADRSSG